MQKNHVTPNLAALTHTAMLQGHVGVGLVHSMKPQERQPCVMQTPLLVFQVSMCLNDSPVLVGKAEQAFPGEVVVNCESQPAREKMGTVGLPHSLTRIVLA